VLVRVGIVVCALVAIGACSRDRSEERRIASSEPRPARTKRDVVTSLLARDAVRITLDARRPGIVVPPAQRSERDLVLRVGYKLTPPIPDLALDDHEMRATLTFNGKPFLCHVPWSAVYGVAVDGPSETTWWDDAIPADLPAGSDAERNASPQ
jgi:hypothetical protein